MADIKVFDTTGAAKDTLQAPEQLEKATVSLGLVHQVALSQLAGRRQGTAATLGRSQVRGSGIKVRRQKGTGRSRQGDKKVPHAKGGGVAHGPSPRDYSQAIPRKMRRQAFATALNSRLQNEVLLVLEGECENTRTKDFAVLLDNLGLAGKKVLFLASLTEQTYLRSARNIAKVKAQTQGQTSLLDVLNSDVVLCTRQAWTELAARVGA